VLTSYPARASARSIDRHTKRSSQSAAHGELGTSTGGNLHHPVVAQIRDEDIAAGVHCYTGRFKQSASRHRGLGAREGYALSSHDGV